jgi:hypothetical protein
MSELYLPPERPQRNPVNGQFLKGHVPHNKGKKWSDYMDGRKAKRIKRIATKNLRPRMDIGGWNKKPIIAMDDDDNIVGWFASAADAERKTGIERRNITSVCNGKRKHAGGFKWCFYE